MSKKKKINPLVNLNTNNSNSSTSTSTKGSSANKGMSGQSTQYLPTEYGSMDGVKKSEYGAMDANHDSSLYHVPKMIPPENFQ